MKIVDSAKMKFLKKYRATKRLSKKLYKNLGEYLRDEKGSAVVEFVALALPLFLPLIIFISGSTEISNNQRLVQSFSRQAARAYVTSTSDLVGAQRLEEVQNFFNTQIQNHSGKSGYSLELVCENTPCLTPDKEIKVNGTLIVGGKSYSASTVEIVDKWRDGSSN